MQKFLSAVGSAPDPVTLPPITHLWLRAGYGLVSLPKHRYGTKSTSLLTGKTSKWHSLFLETTVFKLPSIT